MATSRVLHILTVGVCFLATESSAHAQIFNTPAGEPRSDVQPTSANLEASQSGDARQSNSIPMPRITMPKVTMPKVTMPDMSTVFAPVRSGYSKMTAGTKKAWEGTKEMLTFGQAKGTSTYARRATTPKPSFWERLVGRRPPPAGPQTVADWMAQPRLDP